MIALSSSGAFKAVADGPDRGRSRLTALWLFTVAGFVLLMVIVGGATRLTGSGLSITEWRPVTGAIPPLTDAAWASEFQKYQTTTQFHLVNSQITLAQFRVLYWWEWGHRLLGRLVGVVFAAPFVVLLATRRIPARLVGRCVMLFALGGLQGLAGWWMVKSGLEGRIAVAPERLAVHLGLALLLLASLVWAGLDAWAGPADARQATAPATWRRGARLFAAGVYLQCLMGALVAGNGGGLVDNDWPLMGGRLAPDDYWQGSLWNTLGHGRSAVQFDHRLMAYALIALVAWLIFARSREGNARAYVWTAGGLVLLQAGLGVATLWAGDPLWLALTHQANAAALLAASTALAWRAGR